ncbi:hypothetical protein [Hyperthermus butylicus]|uniref:hypothetical protein n=1 Tax=Hyperthermus butylicus TaxID=54248 RepID=UPI00129A5F97|nr:hypothetical protein [Hyperthermus butylicus]
MLTQHGLSLRLVFDAMHVLAVKEYGLVVASHDEDMGRLAGIVGLCIAGPWADPMAHRIVYPDPAVERAVREVRAIRNKLAELAILAEEAGKKGKRSEAYRVIDAFLNEEIGYDEAYYKLKALARA